MPFAFLAPVFLVGLAALAVPILIHLSSRPRKRTVEFPSLMFLEQVEFQDSSKRRLRHLLLFALRSLALVLVAAAFARPFLDRPDAAATAPDGGREVVVLLDRSGSMAVGDRMDRARQAVGQVADGLRRGDRATLVIFDHGATAVNRATDQAAVLRSAADTVQPGHGATRMAPALRLAESILTGSPLPRRELVLVTDFQRSGWDPAAAPRMPSGTEMRVFPVGEPTDNTFVADVRFGRERFSGRERVRVAATVARRAAGEEDVPVGSVARAAEVPVELTLAGRTIAARTVAVPANGAATVEFEPVTLPDGAVPGTVRAGTDAMPDDNTFHFVLNAGRSLSVLVVEPRRATSRASATGTGAAIGAGEAGAPYLVRALEVSPRHDVATVAVDRLPGVALTEHDVVVLNDADPGDVDGLRNFVAAGGGLLVVLGERARGRTWAGADLLPGTLRGTRDVETGAAFTALRSDHPVFAAFRAGTGGMTAARFYRYRELQENESAEVLARFDGGGAALVVADVGRGRVAALTSSLDGTWSDLVLQPAFVPFTHELVRHLSGRDPGPAWRTVGDLLPAREYLAAADGAGAQDAARDGAGGGEDRPGEPGSGAAGERGTGGTGTGSGSAASRSLGDRPVILTPADEPVALDPESLFTLRERGFYEVRDPRTGLAAPVAVNGDPAESELTGVEPAVVEAALDGGEPTVVASSSFAPEDRERRQSLWWYFLVGAFGLMTAETMLSNRLSRRPLPTLKGGGE